MNRRTFLTAISLASLWPGLPAFGTVRWPGATRVPVLWRDQPIVASIEFEPETPGFHAARRENYCRELDSDQLARLLYWV